MFAWLRRNLGLDRDIAFLTRKIDYQSGEFGCQLADLEDKIVKLRRDIAIQSQAMGRLVAKIDPMFVKPEVPPTPSEFKAPGDFAKAKYDYESRLAESDRLGREAIERMAAEQDARSKHGSGSQGTY